MIEIGKISHSRKILVSPPFEGRAGPPPTFSRLRHPLAPCLVSQIYFGRFFRAPRWSPSIRLRSEVQGVPCSRSNWGSSSTSTEARRPVFLVEMISKVDSEVFAQWRNATKGFSHRKVILVSHGRRDKEILSWRITLSLVKSSVRRLAGGIISASRQDRFTPRLLPPSAHSRLSSVRCVLCKNEFTDLDGRSKKCAFVRSART